MATSRHGVAQALSEIATLPAHKLFGTGAFGRCSLCLQLLMGPLLLATVLNTADCSRCDGQHEPHYDTTPVPAGTVTEPDVHVTTTWLMFQLLPSPGISFGERETQLRLGWQLTPVLFSFGIDPRLSPWRSLVTEPIVRHSGSIELVVSPEYVSGPERLNERWGYRVGLRSTFPLLERGDYLSLSLGTGFLHLHEGQSAEYELGVHALFGNFGLVFGFAPNLDQARFTWTLRLRFF